MALSTYTARKRTRPSRPSSEGPTKTSAHMLNRMSRKPRPFSPVAGARNADVIRRYHSAARHAVQRAGRRVPGVPEHLQVGDDAGPDPGDQEHGHVDGDQRPG